MLLIFFSSSSLFKQRAEPNITIPSHKQLPVQCKNHKKCSPNVQLREQALQQSLADVSLSSHPPWVKSGPASGALLTSGFVLLRFLWLQRGRFQLLWDSVTPGFHTPTHQTPNRSSCSSHIPPQSHATNPTHSVHI